MKWRKKQKEDLVECIVSKWLHHGCFHMLNAKDIFPFSFTNVKNKIKKISL